MLIRFVLENVYSFGDRKEFNMIPNSRLKTLDRHKYDFGNFQLLKLSSIYGANGAGKSNLVKALNVFKNLLISKDAPINKKESLFKFNNVDQKQVYAIEFIQNGKSFYYGLEILGEMIISEELYLSGLGNRSDELIYERKTKSNGHTDLKFLEAFELDGKSQVLKSILIEEFVNPNEPVLKLLSNRDNQYLSDIKLAYKWFAQTLQIITPDAKPRALAHRIDVDDDFKIYATEMMQSFNIGIHSLTTEKIEIHDFFGSDNSNDVDTYVNELEKTSNKMLGLRSQSGDELILVKEDDRIWVKKLKVKHQGGDDVHATFDLDEESDGTVRLLEFVPAFKSLISQEKVFVIDEIERSIHPLLIKELVKKFSLDENTKGQLIFTTHESNLLDQEIFRQDEIWFAEKNYYGSTDLYSLSDFKEHKTIDIRKGYLNGRYGSIPFLSNLNDLNWHEYDTKEPVI